MTAQKFLLFFEISWNIVQLIINNIYSTYHLIIKLIWLTIWRQEHIIRSIFTYETKWAQLHHLILFCNRSGQWIWKNKSNSYRRQRISLWYPRFQWWKRGIDKNTRQKFSKIRASRKCINGSIQWRILHWLFWCVRRDNHWIYTWRRGSQFRNLIHKSWR